MSIYGSYLPPSTGYDTGAPTSVAVPPLPYENNYYQLPDVYHEGTTTEVNHYYQQDVVYTDQVIVKNHIVWQPYHYRTYEYVPPTVQEGPLRLQGEGAQPYSPTLYNNAAANPAFCQQPSCIQNVSAKQASPQELFSQLWANLTALMNIFQQWGAG